MEEEGRKGFRYETPSLLGLNASAKMAKRTVVKGAQLYQ